MKVRFLVTRKRIVKEIAESIANLQKRADEIYYRDKLPKENNNELSSFILEQVQPLKDFAMKLGICEKVYQEAYKIYDFRNSGRTGYTLRDGKIVKESD